MRKLIPAQHPAAMNQPAQENPPEDEQEDDARLPARPLSEPGDEEENTDKSFSVLFPPQEVQET